MCRVGVGGGARVSGEMRVWGITMILLFSNKERENCIGGELDASEYVVQCLCICLEMVRVTHYITYPCTVPLSYVLSRYVDFSAIISAIGLNLMRILSHFFSLFWNRI
jgi:hypothetical protein